MLYYLLLSIVIVFAQEPPEINQPADTDTIENCFQLERGKTTSLDTQKEETTNTFSDLLGFNAIDSLLNAFLGDDASNNEESNTNNNFYETCMLVPRSESSHSHVQITGKIDGDSLDYNPLISPGFGVVTPNTQPLPTDLLLPLQSQDSVDPKKCNLLISLEPLDLSTEDSLEDKTCGSANSCPLSTNGICKCYPNDYSGSYGILKYNINNPISGSKNYLYLTCSSKKASITHVSSFDYELFSDDITLNEWKLNDITLSGSKQELNENTNEIEYSPLLMGGISQTHILLHDATTLNTIDEDNPQVTQPDNINNNDNLENMPQIMDSRDGFENPQDAHPHPLRHPHPHPIHHHHHHPPRAHPDFKHHRHRGEAHWRNKRKLGNIPHPSPKPAKVDSKIKRLLNEEGDNNENVETETEEETEKVEDIIPQELLDEAEEALDSLTSDDIVNMNDISVTVSKGEDGKLDVKISQNNGGFSNIFGDIMNWFFNNGDSDSIIPDEVIVDSNEGDIVVDNSVDTNESPSFIIEHPFIKSDVIDSNNIMEASELERRFGNLVSVTLKSQDMTSDLLLLATGLSYCPKSNSFYKNEYQYRCNIDSSSVSKMCSIYLPAKYDFHIDIINIGDTSSKVDLVVKKLALGSFSPPDSQTTSSSGTSSTSDDDMDTYVRSSHRYRHTSRHSNVLIPLGIVLLFIGVFGAFSYFMRQLIYNAIRRGRHSVSLGGGVTNGKSDKHYEALDVETNDTKDLEYVYPPNIGLSNAATPMISDVEYNNKSEDVNGEYSYTNEYEASKDEDKDSKFIVNNENSKSNLQKRRNYERVTLQILEKAKNGIPYQAFSASSYDDSIEPSHFDKEIGPFKPPNPFTPL